MKPPFPDSYWLEPGRIACGEYPRDIDDPDDHESLRALLDAGVRLFIDLTEEGELKPYWDMVAVVARELGIDPATLEHRRFPVRDVSVPRSEGEMRSILRARDPQPVLCHTRPSGAETRSDPTRPHSRPHWRSSASGCRNPVRFVVMDLFRGIAHSALAAVECRVAEFSRFDIDSEYLREARGQIDCRGGSVRHFC